MKCPKCGSEKLDYDDIEIDSEYAWQVITCDECEYQFHSVYEFVFFEDRETGKEIEVEG